MLGLMQEWPLLIHKIIDFAAIQHPAPRSRDAPRRRPDPPHQLPRGARARDARRAASRRATGSQLGDRVATLAWNGHRHLETWYGITGIGAIYHTVNPRLFPEQIVWIMNHAEDRLALRRSDLRAVARGDRRQAADGRALCRAHRRRAHAGDQAEERRRLRGLDRRSRRRFPLGGIRRAHGRGPLLHLGHHRPSQGRALFAPLECAAFARQHRTRLPAGRPVELASCRSCRCSTPIPGVSPFPCRCAARRW